MALIENKPDFVELLLQNGADLNLFLTFGRLYYLYNSATILQDSKRAPLFEIYKLKYNCSSDKIFINFKKLRNFLRQFTIEDMKMRFIPKDLLVISDEENDVEAEIKTFLVCLL